MISTIRFPKVSYTGWGSIEKLFNELENMNCCNLLVVTDPILKDIGLVEKIFVKMESDINIRFYTDVEPEPSLECGQKLVDFTRKHQFDCVIGLGGGSTLDLAKLTAVISQNEGNVSDYLNLTGSMTLKQKGIPKILIPTTSGTGSEVTDIAVLSLKGTKDVVTHPYLLADVAIVDPQLTVSVPKRVTAATGIDALTHAVEAFVSINANQVTDALALQAMKLIGGSLKDAVHNGQDQKARTDMSYGSYLAGLAFFHTGVAGVHALAYPLGSQFKIPHGESNAVLLPYVMSYIASSCIEKMNVITEILQASDSAVNRDGVQELFKSLVEEVGLPTTLKQYEIPENSLKSLTEDAIKQTRLLARSPMPIEKSDIQKIYQMAFDGR